MGQLGRVYTKDFLAIDPDTIRGQQSYPLAIDGILYVTTNDANVFAIDGATGKILWQHKPQNSAVFKNFGVRANRGLAYCGGKLFILQLDMKVVALDPSDGSVVGELAISQDVPDATVAEQLLRDERADLRERQARLRCRRIGARPARLRDGVHARSEAGLADAVLDDSARPAVVAARLADHRRRPGLDAGHDRLGDEHRLLRHRLGDARLLPVDAPGQQPARSIDDRGRPRDRAS